MTRDGSSLQTHGNRCTEAFYKQNLEHELKGVAVLCRLPCPARVEAVWRSAVVMGSVPFCGLSVHHASPRARACLSKHVGLKVEDDQRRKMVEMLKRVHENDAGG